MLHKQKKTDGASGSDSEKPMKALVSRVKVIIKDFFLMGAGILSAGFGLRGFLLPSKFIDGGATGISLLVSELTDIPLSILLIAINIPFIIIGVKIINKSFAVKSILSISGLAIVVAVFPYPEITNDKLLISIFGGLFLGGGIGLTIRGGAVLDGTEILAIYVSRKYSRSIGDIILALNIIIFSFAAYFLSIETAMYAMLTYLSASKTVDFVVEGIEEYLGITIISEYSASIQDMIKNKMKCGYTVYVQKKGTGKTGEKNAHAEIVYTVVTRLEVGKLRNEVEKIDDDAFIVTQSVKDIRGGMVKKRPLDHIES